MNRLCFTSGGFFVTELETLFKEQFRSPKVYRAIAQRLAWRPASLTELSEEVGVARGGGFADQVENLVRAEFAREYRPVKLGRATRARTALFKLIDPFLIFYFRYIHENRALIGRNRRKENLFRAVVTPTVDQYYGYAFERLVEEAMETVASIIGIGLADIVEMGPYFQRRTEHGRGLQIDWIIRRRDGVWNVLEYKYSTSPVGVGVIDEVEQKIARLQPPPRITIEPVLVSASGVTKAVLAAGYFSSIVSLADLIR